MRFMPGSQIASHYALTGIVRRPSGEIIATCILWPN